MPLNLQTNDGDFTPFIKYNAKAGRWYIRQDGVDGDVEVVNPVLAIDFANIQTGWLLFGDGVGPEKVWDPSPGITAPKPPGPKTFKRGFEVLVYGAGNIGLREFSSVAGSTISAILQMYDEYEKGAKANSGKVPQFACTGVKPITSKYGTNYSPQFTLKGWVERSTIPFDGNGTNGTPTPGILWQYEQAVFECSKVAITKDELVNHLKNLGNSGYNPARDTPVVQAFIREKATAGNESYPFEQSTSYADIPFGWLLPFVLPLMSMIS